MKVDLSLSLNENFVQPKKNKKELEKKRKTDVCHPVQ